MSRQRGPEIAPAPEFPTEVSERGFWGQKSEGQHDMMTKEAG